MFQFVADENFHGDIVRGLMRYRPDLIVLRVQDVGLEGHEDPDVIAWAAENGRILLTHDRKTVPPIAWKRVASGQPMPGVFVFDNFMPIGQAIDEIAVVIECTQPEDWNDLVAFFPI